MFKSKKFLIAIVLFLTMPGAFGQIIYDKNVRNEYNNLYNKLPRQLQDEFPKKSMDPSAENGLAIFTEFTCDTLNKVAQKGGHLSTIILIDPKPIGRLYQML